MPQTVVLSDDLADALSDEASRLGLSLPDYAVRVLTTASPPAGSVRSGTDLVAFWRAEDLVGSRPDIADSRTEGHRLSEETRNTVLALGELRGMLAALAWANGKSNHAYTFTVEDLPAAADVHESLVRHFGVWASKVSAVELNDWRGEVGEALNHWLFEFRDLVKPNVGALTDEEAQQKMVGNILDAFIVGLQPLAVWRVEIEPQGFYECAWDDFAVRGSSGLFLLHLGVSD